MKREKSSRSVNPPELELLESIDKKMDEAIKLLAVNSVKGKEEIDQIKTLLRLGLSSSDIAIHLGVSDSTVRVALHRSKRKSSSKKGGNIGK